MNELAKILPNASEVLVTILKRANNVVEKAIPFIVRDDSADEKALLLLRKVNKTFDLAQSERMEVTKTLDAIKAEMMKPEKAIKAVSDRIKEHRDDYANVKADKARKVQEQIDWKERHTKAKVDLIAECKNMLLNGVAEKIEAAVKAMAKLFGNISTENIDETEQKFKKEVKLGAGFYGGILAKVNASAILKAEEITEIVDEVYKDKTYDKAAKYYLDAIDKMRQTYLAQFQGLREELKSGDLAEAKAEVSAEVAAEAADVISDSQQAINEEQDMGSYEASFQAQAQSQKDVPEQKNVRKNYDIRFAVSESEPDEIYKVLIKVILACMKSPKWNKAIIKAVANNKSTYIAGVQEWLSFYAKNIHEPMEGIELTERIASTARL